MKFVIASPASILKRKLSVIIHLLKQVQTKIIPSTCIISKMDNKMFLLKSDKDIFKLYSGRP